MTELIWDGKYDAQGRKVAPPRIAWPFQLTAHVASAIEFAEGRL